MRVVEFTRMVMGPPRRMVLADLGAEIDKYGKLVKKIGIQRE